MSYEFHSGFPNYQDPSGRVEVAGRTGLATQDYDQIVTVTPALAGSLPAAGAFFGPVGLGAGAAVFLAEQVLPRSPRTSTRCGSGVISSPVRGMRPW